MQCNTIQIEDYNSLKSRAGRSASVSALGGSQSLGTFHFKKPLTVAGLPKSYSISIDGSGPGYLTPSQMGRQELYMEIPFQAVFGLQRRERPLRVVSRFDGEGIEAAARSAELL